VQKGRFQDQTVWPGTNNSACCTPQNDARGIQLTTLATPLNCVRFSNTKMICCSQRNCCCFLLPLFPFVSFPPPPSFHPLHSFLLQKKSSLGLSTLRTTIDCDIPRIPPHDFTMHNPHTVLQQSPTPPPPDHQWERPCLWARVRGRTQHDATLSHQPELVHYKNELD